MRYTFAHGSHLSMPDEEQVRGVVKFLWRGEWKQGFINQMVKNYFDERTDSDFWLDVVE